MDLLLGGDSDDWNVDAADFINKILARKAS